jgi:P-type E1-E2 ATPase
MIWYRESLDEIYRTLETSRDGLTSEQAKERKRPKLTLGFIRDTAKELARPLWSAFALVLSLALILSFIGGDQSTAIALLCVLAFGLGFNYFRGFIMRKMMFRLSGHDIHKVVVLRDKSETMVSPRDVLAGDVIICKAGAMVVSDARIIECSNLIVDESNIDGGGLAVAKSTDSLRENLPMTKQSNMLFRGTHIVSGQAAAVAVEGHPKMPAGLVEYDGVLKTKINDLLSIVVRVVSAFAVVIFVLALSRGMSAEEALSFVVVLSVATIPEGLPVAIAIVLAVSLHRLAKQKIIFRSPRTLEDIGSTTLIVTDKTSLLVKTRRSVVDTWSMGGQNVLTGALKTFNRVEQSDDPLDIALLASMHDEKSHNLSAIYPFDQETLMSGAYCLDDNTTYIKGAPEKVLSLADMSIADRHTAEKELKRMTNQSYKVLAVARSKAFLGDKLNVKSLAKQKVTLIGFVAFDEHISQETKNVIARANKSGIVVKIVSGDNRETAFTIALDAGIAESIHQVVEGRDLPRDTVSLETLVARTSVFARVNSQQKLRIIESLQASERVMVLGREYRDLSSLRKAHVGVSTSSSSASVHASSDVVVIDGSIAGVVGAILSGRAIYANVRHMVFLTLVLSLMSGFLVVGALMIGGALPVNSLQILWVSVVFGTGMALAVGFDRRDSSQKNKNSNTTMSPIFDKRYIVRLIVTAMLGAGGLLFVFGVYSLQYENQSYVQTVMFVNLLAIQTVLAIRLVAHGRPIKDVLDYRNSWILWGVAWSLLTLLVVLVTPTGSLLGLVAVSPIDGVVSSVGVAGLVLFGTEIYRFLSKTNWFKKALSGKK